MADKPSHPFANRFPPHLMDSAVSEEGIHIVISILWLIIDPWMSVCIEIVATL